MIGRLLSDYSAEELYAELARRAGHSPRWFIYIPEQCVGNIAASSREVAEMVAKRQIGASVKWEARPLSDRCHYVSAERGRCGRLEGHDGGQDKHHHFMVD